MYPISFFVRVKSPALAFSIACSGVLAPARTAVMPVRWIGPAQDELGDRDFPVFSQRFQLQDEVIDAPDVFIGEAGTVAPEVTFREDSSGLIVPVKSPDSSGR